MKVARACVCVLCVYVCASVCVYVFYEEIACLDASASMVCVCMRVCEYLYVCVLRGHVMSGRVCVRECVCLCVRASPVLTRLQVWCACVITCTRVCASRVSGRVCKHDAHVYVDVYNKYMHVYNNHVHTQTHTNLTVVHT
jgi:hypothetical protein